MKTGKSIIRRIFSSVVVWAVIGIIAAVIIQKGWNYYNSNRSNISSKLNIDATKIVDMTKESIEKVKQFTNKEKVESVPETKTPAQALTDTPAEKDVFERLGNLADPYAQEDKTVSNSSIKAENQEDIAPSAERQKAVTQRQINLISDLLGE